MASKKCCMRNLTSRLARSQHTGKGLKVTELSRHFLQDVDRRLEFSEIPILLEKLNRSSTPQKFHATKCATYLKEISSLVKPGDGFVLGDNEHLAEQRLKSGQIVNLFGGIETIQRILFFSVAYDLSSCRYKPTKTQQTTLLSLCLEILHSLSVVVDGVAASLAKKNELISNLFMLLQDKKTFVNAASVLEDLLSARKDLIILDEISNLRLLISGLDESQLANLCRVLSFTLTDVETMEERSTLLAQDEQEKKASSQKEIADGNQAHLIGMKEFMPKLVDLACRSLSESPVWPSMFGSGHDGLIEWLGFHAFLEDVLGDGDEEHDGGEMPSIPQVTSSVKLMHEVMYKVEVFYVLCLFLTGKHKTLVQRKLSDLKLVPGMCSLFDKIMWLQSNNRSRGALDMEEERECTPETALKIQFLRLVHSFCDRYDKKHLLLTTDEVDELQAIYVQHGMEIPEDLADINRELCCRGEKGLLSKILEVLIKCPPTAPLRFWLSRAIEGFLRGTASFGDQLFLIKRGLLEHLVGHITSAELKPKEILQSSFDLLGELMKFNAVAFKLFNGIVMDNQFEKFVSVLTANVVDSNMLIRCLVLSNEHFTSEMSFGDFSTEVCKLGTLINNWDQRTYLLYKLIQSITVTTLTQENVSCLNTTLVFLMFAYRHGHLPAYLKAFVMEENLQKRPGFIMSNLRRLLEFWRTHYLRRGKDCSALEQSSCISFDHWKHVVDILLHDDSASSTSVLHYVSPSFPRGS